MMLSMHRALVATTILLIGLVDIGSAANPLLGEVEIRAATRVEKDAGVWLDGQFLGRMRDLKGKSRLVLVPGEHEVLIRLIGYRDTRRTIVVEPGRSHEFVATLEADPNAVYPDPEEIASLKISVEPEEAAVFVNDVYAGHVDQYNGHRGMEMGPGVYKIRIALPGYQAFETELRVLPNQEYEIKTELPKGTIVEQPEGLVISQARD